MNAPRGASQACALDFHEFCSADRCACGCHPPPPSDAWTDRAAVWLIVASMVATMALPLFLLGWLIVAALT